MQFFLLCKSEHTLGKAKREGYIILRLREQAERQKSWAFPSNLLFFQFPEIVQLFCWPFLRNKIPTHLHRGLTSYLLPFQNQKMTWAGPQSNFPLGMSITQAAFYIMVGFKLNTQTESFFQIYLLQTIRTTYRIFPRMSILLFVSWDHGSRRKRYLDFHPESQQFYGGQNSHCAQKELHKNFLFTKPIGTAFLSKFSKKIHWTWALKISHHEARSSECATSKFHSTNVNWPPIMGTAWC